MGPEKHPVMHLSAELEIRGSECFVSVCVLACLNTKWPKGYKQPAHVTVFPQTCRHSPAATSTIRPQGHQPSAVAAPVHPKCVSVLERWGERLSHQKNNNSPHIFEGRYCLNILLGALALKIPMIEQLKKCI